MRTNFLKKYWWAIPVVVLAPLIINWFILCPAFFCFVGKDTDWLGFWGAYIGTILSSVVAFYVLHKQLEQNHAENRYNRELQISIMEYQTKSQWLTELKSKMVDYYYAFSQNDITMLGDCFVSNSNNGYINKEIKRISDKMKIADFATGLLFPNKLDNKESECLFKLKAYTEEFNALLEDLNWLANLYDNEKFRKDCIVRDELTQSFKKKAKQYNNIKSQRVWNLIDLGATKIYISSIANQRIYEGVKMISPDEIISIISELIDYEQEKVNKIILKQNNKHKLCL